MKRLRHAKPVPGPKCAIKREKDPSGYFGQKCLAKLKKPAQEGSEGTTNGKTPKRPNHADILEVIIWFSGKFWNETPDMGVC
jgi:hypothetical protein